MDCVLAVVVAFYGVLRVDWYTLFVVCCVTCVLSLLNARWLLFVVCCMLLFIDCCSRFSVHCVASVVRCVLCVACWCYWLIAIDCDALCVV